MKRIIIFTIIFLISFCVLSAQEPQKFALVIGNGAYTNLSRLNNPVNDANDVGTALRSLGFTVEILTNASLDQME
ncbi:MAG: caspase family protein, partial [Treponema sp.]|nr:caspase family protein [Treponema sp.]